MSIRVWNHRLKALALTALVSALAASAMARAELLSGAALVTALRQGGYVLLMRHARSPSTPPAAGAADADNAKLERQLDDTGRETASAMGVAIRALHIPIGEVWSSPTYRALETVRLAGLPTPKTAYELGDHGQSMQATSASQATWLQAKVASAPRAGTDTILVTHYPNIMAAFGQEAAGLTDGEALVFHPDGMGPAELVARIRIEDWPLLATQ